MSISYMVVTTEMKDRNHFASGNMILFLRKEAQQPCPRGPVPQQKGKQRTSVDLAQYMNVLQPFSPCPVLCSRKFPLHSSMSSQNSIFSQSSGYYKIDQDLDKSRKGQGDGLVGKVFAEQA